MSEPHATAPPLTRRVVPGATFDDLIVPAELMAELRMLPGRLQTREQVRGWGLGVSRGPGITCLFAGPSGTGKTLAAEALAHELGVDLYVANLSQVLHPGIDETERTLGQVFAEAGAGHGVLLFDDADALLGRRAESDSAQDRYANVETAQLLERMGNFDGIAILTTNLPNNLDEACTRRLDVVCAFAEPTAPERRALWERHLPAKLPKAADIDVALLAESLPVSGGVIANITITAAHAAAVESREVAMADLVRAAAREFRKRGRLFKSPALERWLPGAAGS